jgi:dethiobiotin synthetase
LRGFFVTGTGTDVGKTVVAAVIARALIRDGERVAVFKPVVTGSEQAGVSDPAMLRRAADSEQPEDEIAPYRFSAPVSPHLAAELAGETIDPRHLLNTAAAAASAADALVCEGVGGLLVPLAGRYLVRDLAADLGLATVIAASPGLGTINHTLLTIEAARAVGLDIAAVVLTPWSDQPNPIERSNRETIGFLGRVPIKTLPPLELTDPDSWPGLRLDRLASGGGA